MKLILKIAIALLLSVKIQGQNQIKKYFFSVNDLN